jgi:hypothetical protein
MGDKKFPFYGDSNHISAWKALTLIDDLEEIIK